MKKSQLRKIIRESIKELINEQDRVDTRGAFMIPSMIQAPDQNIRSADSTKQAKSAPSSYIPGKICTLHKCNGYPPGSHGGLCIPDSVPNSPGDAIVFVQPYPPFFAGSGWTDPSTPWFIKTSGASCNAMWNGQPINVTSYTSFGNQNGNQPGLTGCWWCCTNYAGGSLPSTSACRSACPGINPPPPPPSGGCDPNAPFPPNFNLQSWTNTWTNLPNFSSSNPNQPCNFICQRRNQWQNQINAGGMGPKQTNQVACKLAEATNQYQIHNCANSSANNCP